jgi:hypothetical protein
MNPRRIGSVLILATLLAAQGLSAQSQFKFKEVVRSGDAAPVPPRLGSVLEFAFSDQGSIALIADGGLILKSGSAVIPIAGPGDSAPGGGLFFSFTQPSLGPQGRVAFIAGASFPSTPGVYLYSHGAITELIANGTQANTGEPVTPGSARFTVSGNLLVSDAFSGTLYLFANNTLTRLVGAGDPAPGGATFIQLLGGAINGSNQVAFQAFLSDGTNGIFLWANGTATKIIASGDVLPDGAAFSFPTAPDINDPGQVVFSGISNSVADSGVFSFFQGHLSVLIPELTPLPDGSLLSFPVTTSVNNAGQIAFSAFTTNANNVATFLFSSGQLSTVETAGETASDGGVFRSGTETGSVINQLGQVLVIATERQHGSALYLFSSNQLSRVIGQGDTIPRKPLFAFPTASSIEAGATILIGDSTFPGGAGAYWATAALGNAPGIRKLAVHVGEPIGADGVVDFLFGFATNVPGQVAAGIASSDAQGALLLNDKSRLQVLADSSPSSPIDPNGGTPAINNAGEIAFNGFDPNTLTSGIFLNAGGQNQLLLSASTPAPGGGALSNFSNLALNRLDQLAFMAQPFPGPAGIFLAAKGVVTPLATDGAPAPGGGSFQLFFGDNRLGPVIDDRGDVAFASALTGTAGGSFGSGGVFLYKNGAVSRIVGPNDPSPDGGVFLFADSPSINSSGDVAFFAETSAFGFGAFVCSNGKITQVAVAGDVVHNVGFGFVDQPVINNSRHVAFTATLDTGENAVFVAAPKDDDDPALSDGFISTQGMLPAPERMKETRTKNDLLQSKRGQPHSGANVKVLDEWKTLLQNSRQNHASGN